MGSSGAGKTTFLNAICDRLASGGELALEGSCQLADVVYERRFRKALGFVPQDDVLSAMDTPYDALRFSLRTRRGVDAAEADARVREMLSLLKLQGCQETLVGTPGLTGGLSGGERKRCSIGVELVCDPKVLLLDEPTSGLDSVTAAMLIRQLRELARGGRTIIYTIHQPTAEVLASFDDLMLLTGGRCAYHGAMADSLAYFESIGFPCPERYTAGDYFMMLLQDEQTSRVLVERWEQHLQTNKRTPHTTSIRLAEDPEESHTTIFLNSYIQKFGSSTVIQLREVFLRRVHELARDRMFIFSLAGQELFFSLIVGLIYIRIGMDIASIQDRAGLLFMVTLNRVFSASYTVLNTFHKVRPVFMREQNAGAYSPLVYFVGTMTAQFPPMIFFFFLECLIIYFMTGLYASAGAFFLYFLIIGIVQEVGVGIGFLLSACFESITLATGLASLVTIPLSLAGGLLASTDRLRPYWYFLEKPSFIRHGFILLMRNEFNRLDHIDCDIHKYGAEVCRNQAKNGKEVLMRMGIDSDPQSKSVYMWISLIGIWCLIRVFCIIALNVVSRKKM
ncbi:unnamed protein product [Phytomonas sp. Hart1]|nr:unnamed protein product [Phytomonas sp. Hart1]|eukprot:CCW71576.1 unnamed protein product [Phytomonas sp. isolate Hart1]